MNIPEMPYVIGCRETVAVNFGVDECNLLHAGIYLGGNRYGALEESLTTANYLTWTIESMLPENVLFWNDDLPSFSLDALEWWERSGESAWNFDLQSNPFTDFYDAAIFRNSESVFLYWRLRVDVDFWKDFPSMAELSVPGAWRFEANFKEFSEQIVELHRELLGKLAELREAGMP